MEPEEECTFVRFLPDGSLQVKLQGREQRVAIEGIEVPQPAPGSSLEAIGERLRALDRPLRCAVRSPDPEGVLRARVSYFAWHDKSGDVWRDLALVLLDSRLARVAPGAFPDRAEYLLHEERARPQWRREKDREIET